MKKGELYLGDALKILRDLPDNYVDSVVTDPPYGLKFMNQKWDYDVPSVELWKEVLRVLKPGGHLLSFFGTRTYHRGVVNIEDAGFEIRDMIQWIYGSGFSKGMDISKAIDKELGVESIVVKGTPKPKEYSGKFDQRPSYERIKTEPAILEAKKWQGWNTTLKPACEPIVLARKPLSEKNIARNVLKWGTGGLNIDGCRIPTDEELRRTVGGFTSNYGICHSDEKYKINTMLKEKPIGRFPANVILDEEAAKMLDEQSGVSKSTKVDGSRLPPTGSKGIYGKYDVLPTERGYNDSGGASRFFYVAKASRDERFAYCNDCNEVITQKEWEKHRNHNVEFHPTVKPLKLMEYLVRLVTPEDGIVLDPFMGTGTTGVAALKQGFKFIGIEIDENYYKIAKVRLEPYLRQLSLEGWFE